jgi:hypothetical protein
MPLPAVSIAAASSSLISRLHSKSMAVQTNFSSTGALPRLPSLNVLSRGLHRVRLLWAKTRHMGESSMHFEMEAQRDQIAAKLKCEREGKVDTAEVSLKLMLQHYHRSPGKVVVKLLPSWPAVNVWFQEIGFGRMVGNRYLNRVRNEGTLSSSCSARRRVQARNASSPSCESCSDQRRSLRWLLRTPSILQSGMSASP